MYSDLANLHKELKKFLEEREMSYSVLAQRAQLTGNSLRNLLLCKNKPRRGIVQAIAKALEIEKKIEPVPWTKLCEEMLVFKNIHKMSLREFSDIFNVSYATLQQALKSKEPVGYLKVCRLQEKFNRVKSLELCEFDEQKTRAKIEKLLNSGKEIACSIAIKAHASRHTVASFMNNQRRTYGVKLFSIMQAVNTLSRKEEVVSL